MSLKKLDKAYEDFRQFCEEYDMETVKIDKKDTYFEAEVSVSKSFEETGTRSNDVELILNNIRSTYSLNGSITYNDKKKTWEFRFN